MDTKIDTILQNQERIIEMLEKLCAYMVEEKARRERQRCYFNDCDRFEEE